jgi:hypothetical protein
MRRKAAAGRGAQTVDGWLARAGGALFADSFAGKVLLQSAA